MNWRPISEDRTAIPATGSVGDLSIQATCRLCDDDALARAAASRVEAENGKLDGLSNNAGIAGREMASQPVIVR
ncbi:hypothetical protein [Phyllobacterium ifriqiyense]|uniref:hypothetical protein n=1 Tax=Phyllobacterium ifriqiyense TaxID=314238 RepID=UPI0033995E8C